MFSTLIIYGFILLNIFDNFNGLRCFYLKKIFMFPKKLFDGIFEKKFDLHFPLNHFLKGTFNTSHFHFFLSLYSNVKVKF